MWRTLFMAIGITLVILGFECMIVEKAIFADDFAVKAPQPTVYDLEPIAPIVTKRAVTPPEWAPWSLMSAGAVVLLYSMTLRRSRPTE